MRFEVIFCPSIHEANIPEINSIVNKRTNAKTTIHFNPKTVSIKLPSAAVGIEILNRFGLRSDVIN